MVHAKRGRKRYNTHCGDLLCTSADLSRNSLSLSSSATRSILCINMKMLASGEQRSIASITFTNSVISFPGSAESISRLDQERDNR